MGTGNSVETRTPLDKSWCDLSRRAKSYNITYVRIFGVPKLITVAL